MKRLFNAVLAFGLSSMAFAGGLLTNTNQNAAFLRQMSQDAVIDITGLYLNPAGTAFLAPGFHITLNAQNAKQSRNITTAFPLFAYNAAAPGEQSHRFEGEANAPVIPSFQLSYNWERWSFNAAFALAGGGGKCEFKNGLGTFEALYSAQIYQQVNAGIAGALAQANAAYAMAPGYAPLVAGHDLAFGGYKMEAYMKGRQYGFGLTLGTTYKVNDNLALALGIKGTFGNNNYNGWVTDVHAVTATPTMSTLSPVQQQVLNGVKQQLDEQVETTLSRSSIDLNCDQTAFGAAPIIGIDWKVNEHWNLAMRAEAPTVLWLGNKTEMNDYTKQVAEQNATLGQFADGKHVREDHPAIINMGAQYSPVKEVRLQAGWHYYFDKQAKRYGNKQNLLDKNTMEFNAGAEWDIIDRLTASVSWQKTCYRQGDAFMNDLSFTNSNNSIGFGIRLKCTERFNMDFGYMHSFYETRDVHTQTAAVLKSDHYWRKNRVVGVGFNIEF